MTPLAYVTGLLALASEDRKSVAARHALLSARYTAAHLGIAIVDQASPVETIAARTAGGRKTDAHAPLYVYQCEKGHTYKSGRYRCYSIGRSRKFYYEPQKGFEVCPECARAIEVPQ